MTLSRPCKAFFASHRLPRFSFLLIVFFDDISSHILMLQCISLWVWCSLHTPLLSPNMMNWIIAKELYFWFPDQSIYFSKRFLISFFIFFFFLAEEFDVDCRNGDDGSAVHYVVLTNPTYCSALFAYGSLYNCCSCCFQVFLQLFEWLLVSLLPFLSLV